MSSRLIVNSIRHTGASGDAVTLANDGTCTANITNRSNRNLIINGAMEVAQRGTSSSATGNQFLTLDRFRLTYNGQDEALTQEQADVASGTTPYNLGFRKCFKITNGNQTSGAGAADYARIGHAIEAQNLAKSGWNYTSASSYITFQFWIKSSVAQSFKVEFYADDSPKQVYSMDTGSLSADTWTKVTKTIPGNSNLTFNNDNGEGIHIRWLPFFGTNYTNNSVTEDAWASYDSTARTKDNTSTWWTTNDATFEITGVQLEVGSVATDFEHRSYAQELALCQRYCYKHDIQNSIGPYFTQYHATHRFVHDFFPVTMRAQPSYTVTYNTGSPSGYYPSTNHFKAYIAADYDLGSSIYIQSAIYTAEL